MMQWFFWAIGVAAIISASGLLIERVMRVAALPVRAVWVVALLASFLAPLIAVYRTSLHERDARVERVIAEARAVDAPLPADPSVLPGTQPQLISAGDVGHTDYVRMATLFLLFALYAAMPLGMLYEFVTLRRDRLSWRSAVVDGHSVLVSSAFGPAIVGVFRPSIVMPSWSVGLPSEERSLLLAHELEHIRLHDSRLLLFGMSVLMLMPWNLAAWWQLSRLRLAIELDCDARVLRVRPGASSYGKLLIDVTGRAVGARLAVTAFAERRSSLRSRLEFMTPSARDRSVPLAVGAAIAALLLLGCASVAPRPDAPAPIAFKRGDVAELEFAVADSVVSLTSNRALRAAVDLPRKFDVESMGPSVPSMSQPTARCGQYLRDPRDSTRLQLNKAISVTSTVQRGDTSVTTTRSAGFYRVVDGSRYGVSASEPDARLRIGCDTYTYVAVNGRPFGVRVTTLSTPGDSRARTVAAQVAAETSLTPDSLELRPHRVHVTFVGGSLASMNDDARFDKSEEVARVVWRAFGRDARTDTVSVAVRKSSGPKNDWVATASFYPEQLAGKH